MNLGAVGHSSVRSERPEQRLPRDPHKAVAPSENHVHLNESAVSARAVGRPARHLFDQHSRSILIAEHKSHLERELDLAAVKELQALLLHGTSQYEGKRQFPFTFVCGQDIRTAHGVGLEGFLHGERELRRSQGKTASVQNLSHYYQYLKHLLEPVHWTGPIRKEIKQIFNSSDSEERRYDLIMETITKLTQDLRDQLVKIDCSRWVRDSAIYQIWPRTFNLAGWRQAFGLPAGPSSGQFFTDFTDSDISHLVERGFNTIYILGAFPIGQLQAKGDAGGSPFSIKNHGRVDPAHGSDGDVRDFVLRCNKLGVQVIVDLVLNHSAIDADLVKRCPESYIHIEGQLDPSNGYHYCQELNLSLRLGGYHDDKANNGRGGTKYWTDTLQYNLWNPDLRRILIATVKDLLDRYSFNGFRVDMAYQMLNEYFERNWAGQVDKYRYPKPPREFLEELISEIKAEYPGTAFIAEGYGAWTKLSELGFDAIFGFNDMDCDGSPHCGWYQGLISRDPEHIRGSIQRSAFLHCSQAGGADMITFFGDHDRPAPWNSRGFGESWVYGATYLTMLKPGPILFYGGQEVEFEAPCSDGKAISFERKVQIDWSRRESDFGKLIQELRDKRVLIENYLGSDRLSYSLIRPTPGKGDQSWVGYVIYDSTQSAPYQQWVAVIANPTDQPIVAECHDPNRGVDFVCQLGPAGPEGAAVLAGPANRSN